MNCPLPASIEASRYTACNLMSASRRPSARVDVVITMSTPAVLAAWTDSPESRCLALAKALEATEARQRREYDHDRLLARTIGIERCTSRLGRLIGYRQAGWWPPEWRPPKSSETSLPTSGYAYSGKLAPLARSGECAGCSRRSRYWAALAFIGAVVVRVF
jgi:hypothetical protein